MTIQYPLLGFEPTTSCTWVFSLNPPDQGSAPYSSGIEGKLHLPWPKNVEKCENDSDRTAKLKTIIDVEVVWAFDWRRGERKREKQKIGDHLRDGFLLIIWWELWSFLFLTLVFMSMNLLYEPKCGASVFICPQSQCFCPGSSPTMANERSISLRCQWAKLFS